MWVSSGGMYTQKLDLAKAQALVGVYDGVKAYAQHKRAQVLLSEIVPGTRRSEADKQALWALCGELTGVMTPYPALPADDPG